MLKKLIPLFLVLSIALSITACGGKTSDVTGRYEVVSAKWEDGSGSPAGEWVELEKSGEGTIYLGLEYDIKWKLDGETFTGMLDFFGVEDSLDGTLKDGVLSVQYADVSYVFTKEGIEAPLDTDAKTTEDIEAPVDTDTTTTDNESAEGENEFAGAHDFTLKTFADSIETMLQLTVPDEGWCTELNSGTLRVYNVPTLDDAYSNSPRIQFETKETVEGFDLHIDEFENLEVIESRVIGGIEMTGRTYGQWGMDWIEYVGQLPNGVAISIKIALIDIGPGTEGSSILDSVSFK